MRWGRLIVGSWAAVLVATFLLAGCAQRTCVSVHDLESHIASRETSTQAAVARVAQMNIGEDLQILAISSGGQNGAFAAGVVNGWRAADRPDFHIVAGVSTGALLASFVFVNAPDADALAKQCFTTVTREDIVEERSRISIPFVESIAKSDKLAQLLRRYVTNAMIDRVAERSENGRLLLLASTTDLDCGAMRTWDMTELARQREYDRYRKVLLAAASIPLILPPVIIDGEMHVDGGVCEQVFVPDVHAALAAQPGADPLSDPLPRGDVYVIANSAFASTRECVQPNLPDIWSRGLATLISKSMVGSLWRAWGMAQMRDYSFRMIHIPNEYAADAVDKMAFDMPTMRRLYDLGERMGANVGSWSDVPPDVMRKPAAASTSPNVAPAPVVAPDPGVVPDPGLVPAPDTTPPPTPVPAPAGGLPPPTIRSPAK